MDVLVYSLSFGFVRFSSGFAKVAVEAERSKVARVGKCIISQDSGLRASCSKAVLELG